MASAKKGPKGEILMKLLECKLDNIIFRAGFASTRAQAKQLVGHSHLTVNGKQHNIASMLVKAGDKISVVPKERSVKMVAANIDQNNYRDVAGWMKVDKQNKTIEIVRIPEFSEIPLYGDPQMIVELYSKTEGLSSGHPHHLTGTGLLSFIPGHTEKSEPCVRLPAVNRRLLPAPTSSRFTILNIPISCPVRTHCSNSPL
ncbi:hypothetical protein CHS0354_006926 [Potamilus streckersoni]|uniref:RNA-binding S4 domain-containing protein n=1 Tax=Potamilus streckersoni TaxID=2493646 RepID=A0AAE0TEF2_9BIVA|nr:hypothetical protein CHS0354_006926 [Potamilus streckersoni]